MKTDSGNIYYEISGKGDILILYFHGLFDSIDNSSMKKVRSDLSKKFKVLAFDYPGHGKSHGYINSFTLKKTMETAKNLVRKIKYKKLFVLGYSFGCYPSVLYASRNDANGVILYNPASDLISLSFNKKSENELGKYTENHKKLGILSRIRLMFEIMPVNIYSVSKKIKSPFLVFHSINDAMVNVKQSYKLEKNIKNGKFNYIKGEDHVFSNDILDKEIIKKTIEFIMS